MAWTTPRTWVASEVVSASIMNTHVRDNFDFIAAEPHELWLKRTTNQSISDVTETSITWTAEDRDVGFGFTPSGTTVTVQQVGIYAMTGNVQWAGTGGGLSGYVGFRVGSTTLIGNGGSNSVYNEGNQKCCTLMMRLAASETVQMRVFQNTGGALDAQAAGGSAGTIFRIVQVQRTVS